MAIEVIEESDGSLTISWDENDPNESIFNDWSSEDFTNLIKKGLEEIIKKDNQSN
jgi:hypothetical protein